MSKKESNSALVVIYGTAQYKKLEKDMKGQLTKACADFKEKDNVDVEISFPTSVEADYVRVVKTDAKSPQEWRDFGGKYFKMYNGKVTNLHFGRQNADVSEGAILASYEFDKYKTKNDSDTLKTEIHSEATLDKSIHESVFFARDLITEPGNALYPEEYADRIYNELTPLGVSVKIIPERQLRKLGFGLLLSVGEGSEKDSYVAVMEWNNGPKDKSPLALVGKGVTFDSGGISLKPGRGMGDMKYDMGGSASVVGAMHAIASQKVEANVIGIVGLVENMPSGRATRPGDVIKSLDGQTVENLNTDAEGRLVLADILTYVQREYKPSHIIDLATLTGAILVTLGHEAAGLFTNSSDFGNSIISSGKQAGEEYYQMPMGKNWAKMVDSPIADMQNIGGSYGGSTTAAEFLYKFVDKETPWAHLDIAGMCWADSPKDTCPKGAVGFGVRTLYNIATEFHSAIECSIDEDMKY